MSEDEADAHVEAWENLEERKDIRTAEICLRMMQAMGAKPKGGQKWKRSDFMPLRRAKPKNSEAELKAALGVFQG